MSFSKFYIIEVTAVPARQGLLASGSCGSRTKVGLYAGIGAFKLNIYCRNASLYTECYHTLKYIYLSSCNGWGNGGELC